jgi:hypothetical protein
LSGNDTTLPKCTIQKLEVSFLEQSFGRAFGITRVSDDHIELVLAVFHELEAIADDGLYFGVLESDRHAGEVLLGETDDSLHEN